MIIELDKAHPDFSTFFDVFIEAGMKEPFQEMLKNSLLEIEQQSEKFGVHEAIVLNNELAKVEKIEYSLVEKNSGYRIDYDHFQFIELEKIWLTFHSFDDEYQVKFYGFDVGIKLLTENSLLSDVYLFIDSIKTFSLFYREKCREIKEFKSLDYTKYTTFGIQIQDIFNI